MPAKVITSKQTCPAWPFAHADSFEVNNAHEFLVHLPAASTTLLLKPSSSEPIVLRGLQHWGNSPGIVWHETLNDKAINVQRISPKGKLNLLTRLPISHSNTRNTYTSRGGIFSVDNQLEEGSVFRPDSGWTTVPVLARPGY